MTSYDQLKQLLDNALEEGFTAEDICDLATDLEQEKANLEADEEYIDNMQNEASEALADFLVAVGYYDEEDEDFDFDEAVEAIYNSLQLIREGKLKVSVKSQCCGKCNTTDKELEGLYSIFHKFF